MNTNTFSSVPLSLYIHIPWCVRKCPYCDFNSHQQAEALPERDYIRALLTDLEQQLPAVWGRRVNTVFIGGGTPSLFSADAIHDLLAHIRALLPLRPDAEITLEANPGTVDNARFVGFRQAGVTRLSIGIQSFNHRALQALGRIHDENQAIQAVEAAQRAGFENVNVDIMFGLPQQSIAQALQDLRTAMSLQPSHVSWYQLTLEPNTLFYQQPPKLPDEDLLSDMFLLGQDLLAQQGYERYEVSAYAKDGRGCQHNLNYWLFGDYIGIGAGAHGKISDAQHGTVTRYSQLRHPRAYLEAAVFTQQQHALNAEDLRIEFMLNALRLVNGFEPALFKERTGLELHTLQDSLEQAERKNWLTCSDRKIQPTATGLQFLNEILFLF